MRPRPTGLDKDTKYVQTGGVAEAENQAQGQGDPWREREDSSWARGMSDPGTQINLDLVRNIQERQEEWKKKSKDTQRKRENDDRRRIGRALDFSAGMQFKS